MLTQCNFKITYYIETLNEAINALSKKFNLYKEGYKKLYNTLLKIISNSSLKYNQLELGKIVKIAKQVETL